MLDTEADMPSGVPDPDLVDDNTGLVGSYKQLSGLTKDCKQMFAMAMWDIQNKFRYIKLSYCDTSLTLMDTFAYSVRIDGIDGLDRTLAYKSVFVEVGLFHGGKPLTPMVATNEVPFSRSVRWGQRLTLDIKTRDLPKVYYSAFSHLFAALVKSLHACYCVVL